MPDPRGWLRVGWQRRRAVGDRKVVLRAVWAVTVLVAAWGAWQVLVAGEQHSPPSLPETSIGAPPSSTVPPSTATPLGLGRSAPVTISIASIEVHASIDQVGLAPDGALEEQPLSRAENAAWYRLGPSPGQVGPAVIVGHVDTKHSQAVFFNLTRLRPGARVVITRADGHTVTFTVDSLDTYPKTAFPTKLVYGQTSYPALRLVTCGGPFDRVAGSYRDNIVVFLHMASYT